MITYIGQSYPVRVTRRVNTVFSWRKHLELVLKLHVISAFDLHANAPVIFRGKKQKKPKQIMEKVFHVQKYSKISVCEQEG